jgi:hypothetical protein
MILKPIDLYIFSIKTDDGRTKEVNKNYELPDNS